jgi:hypothetical protein
MLMAQPGRFVLCVPRHGRFDPIWREPFAQQLFKAADLDQPAALGAAEPQPSGKMIPSLPTSDRARIDLREDRGDGDRYVNRRLEHVPIYARK